MCIERENNENLPRDFAIPVIDSHSSDIDIED